MILHGYWRSGTSYRTRIALNLKGLNYEQHGVDLRQLSRVDLGYLVLKRHHAVCDVEVIGSGLLAPRPDRHGVVGGAIHNVLSVGHRVVRHATRRHQHQGAGVFPAFLEELGAPLSVR